jgi:subtilisin family serine protease
MTITEADAARGFLKQMVLVRDSRPVPVSSGVLRSTTFENDLIASGDALAITPVFSGMPSPAHGVSYRVIELRPGLDSRTVARSLSSMANVRAEPVYVGAATRDEGDEPGGTPPTPNDDLFPDQYALLNTGQVINGVTGIAGADIGVVGAWERTLGAPQVTIAVVDSGVAVSHPDLIHKLIDGANVTGGSVTNTDAQFNSHGTHIAGIVAAQTNNTAGVTGISWGSPIMPVKAANDLGFTSDVWLAEGIVWAANQGADVAVVSFGLESAGSVLADAVRYAAERGMIVCASSGNLGQPGLFYPAAFPEVIGVGATDSRDTLAGFSTTGGHVDLVAPGVNICSTWHTFFEPNTYKFQSGTSVSTPMVAGVIALLRSVDPTLTADRAVEVLGATSRDLGSLGRDTQYGEGRINAARAVLYLMGEPWCAADANGDGLVLSNDLSAWIEAYNDRSLRADQNGNGTIEAGDFSSFIQNFISQDGCH